MCLSVDNVLLLTLICCFLNGMNEHVAMKLCCILSGFPSTASLHVFRRKKEQKRRAKQPKQHHSPVEGSRELCQIHTFFARMKQ